MNTTIAALATATGKASLCVVRISGEEAFLVAKKVFIPKNKDKDIEKQKGYTALFGSAVRKGKEIDEAVALIFRAPYSFTGENTVEISCHGGQVVADQLLKACYEAGARPAQAGEFTKMAFLNGKMNLTQAEAVIEMINATSNQALVSAKSALEGNLYKKASKIRDDLLILVGHITAYTDFPEEAVEEVSEKEITEILTRNKEELKKLIDGYDLGSKINKGVKTAIVGKPNAGKSTLLNSLSGFEKAIVTPIAGTTRDVVEQEIILGNINLILQDTAGIRETENEIENIGIQKSLEKFDTANLIFCVFDGNQEITKEDIQLSENCKDKNSIAIINKQDLEQKFSVEEIKDNFKEILYISAKDFYLSKEFEEIVLKVIGAQNIDVTTDSVVNERQYEAIRRAYNGVFDALESFNFGHSLDIIGVCIDESLYAIYELTGENVSEEIIAEVFSKFCVGK